MSRKKSISTTQNLSSPTSPLQRNLPMNIPPIVYAIEALFLRIFIRPILNTVERFTGFSNLEFAVGISLQYLIMTILAAAMALLSAEVTHQGDDLKLVRIMILPIISLSVYYSVYLTLVAWARLEHFKAEKDTEVVHTDKIIHDPKRLGWYLGFIVCIIVMREHAKHPFVIYLLFPFCGFAPILVLCGIRPYYDASEAAQRKRKVREMTTFATIALLLMCAGTHFLHKGDYNSKLLLDGAYVVIYVLIYKLIRSKKHDTT